MLALLSGLFGLLGVTLACMALYWVLSNAVSDRAGEIGIRMALGADRASVVWMVLRESILLALIVAAIVISIASASSRVIAGPSFGLTPGDPVTLVLATVVSRLSQCSPVYLPAHRASPLFYPQARCGRRSPTVA